MRHDIALEVLPDADALAHRVADWLLALALAANGRFAIALAGGTTPRAAYALLAAPTYRERFPWQRTHWFWGDERFVPPDDPRSNYRMVREAMLAHANIPATNIHAVPTEHMSPQEAASAYERALKSFYGSEKLDPARPLFGVNLLGLGEDGHFASLFPGSDALEERQHWTAAVTGPQGDPRITLTYPALESCRHAAFVVSGAAKSAKLHGLLTGGAFPAARFRPLGELRVFADEQAAGRGNS
ncbi:MAG TPA: 6-phosphogluconolactonase [Micropepsaceae bacterium]|nr:6-phosphogluconolactonase [Micropepsaceae bacterium]